MLELGGPPPAGYTMMELLVTLAVAAFLLGVAVPGMGNWLLANKARAASEFYLDGFSMARRAALAHNTSSRIVLTPNTGSGQLDWQVDLCYPAPAAPCTDGSGAWSTTTEPSLNDPLGAAGFVSVYRSAAVLPDAGVLAPSTMPEGSSKIYYTALGWVDPVYPHRLARLRLDPAARYAGEVPAVALAIGLAGMPSRCDPTRPASDSRGCPP